MTSRPPHYSSLPPKAPPLVLGYTPPLAPPPPLRADAPYPIGSRWELRYNESAVIDSDVFVANPGLLHPHDFASNKEYPRGTVVEIMGHGSRRYKVNRYFFPKSFCLSWWTYCGQVHSPPLHRDFALYIACVMEIDQPCFSQAGPSIELLPGQIKVNRTSSSPATTILNVCPLRTSYLSPIKSLE